MSRRFAVAVALIAGLLGMHGFTSNHGSMPPPANGMGSHSAAPDATMAMPGSAHAPPGGAAAAEPAADAAASSGGSMAKPVNSHDLAGAAAAEPAAGEPAGGSGGPMANPGSAATATSVASVTDGAGHAMGALCLAILTGLGWLLLTLLLGRRERATTGAAGRLHPHARAAEPAPPSLSELCVLRT
ncbi:hypothetical protein [Flindersiella endophytica]